MAALTSAPLWLFACSWIIVHCEDTKEVTVKPGEDVPLQCRGPRGANITLIEWSRPDLGSDQYVFLFRDGHLNENYLLPSFRGRVELRDPEMKDGDTSVVLKNVITNDTGTYECQVSADSNRRRKRAIETFSIITLTVTDPDPDPHSDPDPDQQEITARPGQDVPLQCQGPRDASVKLLEWNRPDLKSDGYVFFYRNERSYENYLLPSFRGRVELSDPEMKGGDFSVVLKNVTTNDSGTYECRAMIVTLNETTPSEIRNLVPLTVTDADHTAAKIWAGGNTAGGNTAGGNTAGGNTAGGNTAGGNTHWCLGVVVCLYWLYF